MINTDHERYVFKDKLTKEYWIAKGRTTPNKKMATHFNFDQAARFIRTCKHPNRWIKEKY